VYISAILRWSIIFSSFLWEDDSTRQRGGWKIKHKQTFRILHTHTHTHTHMCVFRSYIIFTMMNSLCNNYNKTSSKNNETKQKTNLLITRNMLCFLFISYRIPKPFHEKNNIGILIYVFTRSVHSMRRDDCELKLA
jgi:hypothetical protein